MKRKNHKFQEDTFFTKYVFRQIDLIKTQLNLPSNAEFFYLGIHQQRDFYLNRNQIYVINCYSHLPFYEINLDTLTPKELYCITLLTPYPKNLNEIKFDVVIGHDKYSYTAEDFLDWIDSPCDITKEIDLPFYKIIDFLNNYDKDIFSNYAINNYKNTDLEYINQDCASLGVKNYYALELLKQTINPEYILHEWGIHRIFSGDCNNPKRLTNIWVEDMPDIAKEPFFFITDDGYTWGTNKVATINFKTPTYSTKGIYKSGLIKFKGWELNEQEITKLIEFLNAPAEEEMYKKTIYKKYVKTNWQQLIFEFNHNTAGWGWGDEGFEAPLTNYLNEIEPLPFDLPMPDYKLLLQDKWKQ
jgi:hypothetical protein